MRDAVIHPQKRDVEGEGEGPRRGRDGAKAWAQPRALRERDQVEVLKIHPRNVGRFPDQRHDHLRVVIRGLSRMDPDRESTRLNSSHRTISYAAFCLTKQTKT